MKIRDIFTTNRLLAPLLLGLLQTTVSAQVSVLGGHNDIGRTGVNAKETILTPGSVGSGNFEKLLTLRLVNQQPSGQAAAQPLYVPGVQIGGASHNLVIAATTGDDVFAFDADSGVILWHITLLDSAHGAGPDAINDPNLLTAGCQPNANAVVIGISGTPTIDASTGTIYLVGRTWENNYAVQRLHALDITTGAETLGGPTTIQATVSGSGWGSTALGQVNFDPLTSYDRAGLLLLNGIVYIAFDAYCEGTIPGWHGWVMGYDATTLRQTGAWATTPDATGSGIWMSGAALAADVPDPVNRPFGRMFVATGNGSFNAVPPYTAFRNFGDDIVRLDLTNGAITPEDSFTVHDQARRALQDGDLGSSGVMILPDSVGSVQHPHLLVQGDKAGIIFLVDRDNMGGYNATTDQIVQELTGALAAGLYSTPAYWNGSLYFWASTDHLKAFSIANGLISPTPTSISAAVSTYPGATPSISANGNTNGIVWALTGGNGATLQAYDAADVSKQLYSSDTNLARDSPDRRTKFSVATVANGKVYVGSSGAVYVFGSMFTVSAQSPTLEAVTGSDSSVTINVESPPGSSFTGAVTLVAAGLPVGVTANFSVAAVSLGHSPTAASSALKLNVPDTMPAGNYSFQVIASNNNLQSIANLTLSVVQPVLPLSVVSLSPNLGSGAKQTFTGVYSDPNGSADIATVRMLFNNSVNVAHACYVLYYQSTNTLYLENDSATGVSAGVTPGSAAQVSNGQCTLMGAGSSVSIAGNVLTLNAALTFSGNFLTQKNVYLSATENSWPQNSAATTGWVQKGTWGSSSPEPLSVVSLSPSVGSGTTQIFTGVYSDPNGSADIATARMLFGSPVNVAHGCYVLYYQSTNTLYLENDSATGVSAGVTPGSAAQVSNGQCTLMGAGSSISIAGNELTLNAALTFNESFLTQKNVYLSATENSWPQNSLANTGWVQKGTWTP